MIALDMVFVSDRSWRLAAHWFRDVRGTAQRLVQSDETEDRSHSDQNSQKVGSPVLIVDASHAEAHAASSSSASASARAASEAKKVEKIAHDSASSIDGHVTHQMARLQNQNE
jgi:hypothetical protein